MEKFKGFTSSEWKKIWDEIDDKEYGSVESKFQNKMSKQHGPGYYYMDNEQYWDLKTLLIQRVVNKWIKEKLEAIKGMADDKR